MSKKQELLEFLKEKPRTTYELCVNGFAACYRQRISDLREDGHIIEAETQTVGNQRHTTYTYKGEIKNNLTLDMFTDMC